MKEGCAAGNRQREASSSSKAARSNLPLSLQEPKQRPGCGTPMLPPGGSPKAGQGKELPRSGRAASSGTRGMLRGCSGGCSGTGPGSAHGMVVPWGREPSPGSFPALSTATVPGGKKSTMELTARVIKCSWCFSMRKGEWGGTALLARNVKNSYGLKAAARWAGSPGGWRPPCSDVSPT